MQRGLEIELFTEEHYPAVFDLYERAWPGDKQRRKDAFRRLHDGNPHARPETAYVLAFKDGVLAGYWGRMPVELRVRGQPIRCVFSQEALVDPQFRRQGIAKSLMLEAVSPRELYLSLWHNEKILALLLAKGWQSVGGYRPQKAVYSHAAVVGDRLQRTLGWKLPRPISGLRTPGVGSRKRVGGTQAITMESLDAFGLEFDGFFEAVAPSFEFVCDRGSAVLNWRYCGQEGHHFQRRAARDSERGDLRGYAVFTRREMPETGLVRGDIVDLLVAPDDSDALDALASEAHRWMRAEGVHLAVALHADPRIGEGLRRAGFRASRREAATNQLLYLDRRASQSPPVVEGCERWAITHGDSDAFLW